MNEYAMPHPHQAMLDEFDYAIKHFVPSVPQEVKTQAVETLSRLQNDPHADEDAIKNAFHDIGVLEYPHRKAFQELSMSKAGDRMKMLVLEHVDEVVRKVIKPHLAAGVDLHELVDSDLFQEQLDPKQRYQVIDGILVAQSKLADELDEHFSAHSVEYQELLKKWQKQANEIDKKISAYVALADQCKGDQKQEVLERAKEFREGFLLTERDPVLGEIEREIEYLKASFEEGE